MNGPLTPPQRFFLAFVAFFLVLFDRRFAEAVSRAREQRRALPPGGATPEAEGTPAADRSRGAAPSAREAASPPAAAAARKAPEPVEVPSPPPPVAPPTPVAAPAAAPTPVVAPAPAAAPAPVAPPPPVPDLIALHVLGLLQRDGRLVDFLSEDLNGFSDAEIGAAARTVHEGCRKTLAYVELEPIYRDAEGATVTVATGFDPATVRLTGNVVGDPPFRGSLRHHGWRARKASFPPVPAGHDPHVLAPAEVEL